MKFFLSKSSQSTLADRRRVNKDYYEFNKTVVHGFPANPTCLAYDNYHKLLAIGTKNGAIQIYGKPGVEFHYEFETDFEVVRLLFVPLKGQIICLCSDFSLHLLQISHQLEQFGIQHLQSNNDFVNDEEGSENSVSKNITTIAISRSGSVVFIGTKSGEIRLLDICNFKLKEKTISQVQVQDLKKPGPVEAIEENPVDNGKILIGYNRSLIALWDFENDQLVKHFPIEQQLESLSWNDDGLRFISSHNDGSYITWNINNEQQQPSPSSNSSKLPYGPFPCKAITKILWNCTNDGDYFIFSGGMPRASYGEKEVVSIIYSNSENLNQEKNHVLDFTSKVVDFLVINSADDIPEALVVLVEEEIVVLDLVDPEWPQHKLPYLSCLHSSPITCSQHCSNVNVNICNRIIEAGKNDCNIKYSTNEWPIKGGICKYQASSEAHDILITGHEDGTVRFWDASTTSLRHLYTLSTSKLFWSSDDDIALIDSDDHDLENEDQNEWPPFRRVGQFDPYSDDHRFAIRKVIVCPTKGILAVGGTAGQLAVFELQDKAAELNVTLVKLNLVDDKDGFVWKGHGALPIRNGKLKFNAGYQPSSLVQINPPAALTALTISSQWQVIAAGTAHGFGLYDYTSKNVLVCKTTLKQASHSSVAGGEALISRRKSFKKSLRESFRRLRKGRSQKGKRNPASGNNPGTKANELNKLSRYDDVETKPVERQIEARTEADMMSSMVRYLYFCSAVVVNNTLYPSFWVGTNAGTVFIYILTSDKGSSSGAWQLAKEIQLKHKAPIVFIRLIDSSGAPIFENNNDHDRHSRVLICSEEQFKLFSLPNFKTLHKFKLTAHEGARVRRIDLGLFSSKSNEGQSEYSLMCLTNLGDVSIFSHTDFKRKYQNHFLKKEDINGITSSLFTKFGEGFYLRSASEYQKFSISRARFFAFSECFIQLPEQPRIVSEAAVASSSTASSEEDQPNVESSKEEPVANESEDAPVELDATQSTTSHNQSSLNNTTESVIDHLSETAEEDKVKNGVSVSANTNGSIALDNA